MCTLVYLINQTFWKENKKKHVLIFIQILFEAFDFNHLTIHGYHHSYL